MGRFTRPFRGLFSDGAPEAPAHQDSETKVDPTPRLGRSESPLGGWAIPDGLLTAESVCYCTGLDADLAFEADLIKRYGCQVFCFDPSRAVASRIRELYLHSWRTAPVEADAAGDSASALSAEQLSRLHFLRCGLGAKREMHHHYGPDPRGDEPRLSRQEAKGADFIETEYRTIRDLMVENGHNHIQLLKLDIGADGFDVIEFLVSDRVPVDAICADFNEPGAPQGSDPQKRAKEAVRALAGRNLVAAASEGLRFTFVSSGAGRSRL